VSIAAALEVLIGFTLLRALRFRPELDRIRDVVMFFCVCVLVSLLSASVSVAALAWTHLAPYIHFQHTWRPGGGVTSAAT